MLLDALREYTQTRHTALEKDFDLLTRLTSLSEYRSILQRYLGFFQPMESRLRQAGADGQNLGAWRTACLVQDLRMLGGSDELIEALPRCAELPGLSTAGAAMGCRYVIEGSALGGQVIYRQMRERFGIDEGSGASFFYGAGDATGRHWRDFCSRLNAFGETASPSERAAALEAASETFAAIQAFFCKNDEAYLCG